ncbi:MAG: IS66-like element accessory protein TnpA [Hyphomicrobium sp.]
MTSVEVITSVERRRRWSPEEKQRLVAESARPGRTASQVARANGIAPGQLFTWRRQFLAEATGVDLEDGGFVPVQITAAPTADGSGFSATSVEPRIEIRLPSGVVIGVGHGVEIEPLRRVLTALAGR